VGMGLVGGMVWVHHPAFELDGVFVSLPFGYGCIAAFFSFTVCVPPLLYSFSSLLCLLSCLCAVVIPLFVLRCFNSSAVLFSQSCVLFAQFIAQSERDLRRFPLASTSPRYRALLLPSVSSQIAEPLHTVHTCLVSRCITCIS